MRAEIVVVVTRSAERPAHMGEVVGDLFIEEFVPQASIEAFDEGVLRPLMNLINSLWVCFGIQRPTTVLLRILRAANNVVVALRL